MTTNGSMAHRDSLISFPDLYIYLDADPANHFSGLTEDHFLAGASAALSREGRVTGHRCLHIVATKPVEGTHETEMRLLNIKPPPLAPFY